MLHVKGKVQAIFREKEVAMLTEVLGAENLRLVGGAVRDLYLGREPKDLDFATSLPFEDAIRKLHDEFYDLPDINGTGERYNTVTVRIRKRHFQITCLRRDTETDGRHAKTEPVVDWKSDANRRDFTMNAIYADSNGVLYDYHNGIADIDARCIAFIGDAEERVKEDLLRIMRYFRFHAQLGWKVPENSEARDAFVKWGGMLPEVSRERIWQEFALILGCEVEMCLQVLDRMMWSCVDPLPGTLTRPKWQEAFRAYDALEIEQPDENLHLARLAIMMENPLQAQTLFALSKKEQDCLRIERFESVLEWDIFTQKLYEENGHHPNSRDAAPGKALAVAGVFCALEGVPYEQFVDAAKKWKAYEFPLSGSQFVGVGIPHGPAIGVIKAQVHEWWLRRRTKVGQQACMTYAARINSVIGYKRVLMSDQNDCLRIDDYDDDGKSYRCGKAIIWTSEGGVTKGECSKCKHKANPKKHSARVLAFLLGVNSAFIEDLTFSEGIIFNIPDSQKEKKDEQ